MRFQLAALASLLAQLPASCAKNRKPSKGSSTTSISSQRATALSTPVGFETSLSSGSSTATPSFVTIISSDTSTSMSTEPETGSSQPTISALTTTTTASNSSQLITSAPTTKITTSTSTTTSTTTSVSPIYTLQAMDDDSTSNPFILSPSAGTLFLYGPAPGSSNAYNFVRSPDGRLYAADSNENKYWCTIPVGQVTAGSYPFSFILDSVIAASNTPGYVFTTEASDGTIAFFPQSLPTSPPNVYVGEGLWQSSLSSTLGLPQLSLGTIQLVRTN